MLAFVVRNRLALINLGLWIVFFVLLYFGLTRALPFVMPLLLGFLIAILLEPIVKLLTRLRLPRALASLLTLLVFFGGGLGLLVLLAARLMIELADFTKQIPDLAVGVVTKGQDLLHQAIEFYGTLSPAMSEKVRYNLNLLADKLAEIGKSFAGDIVSGLTNIPSLLTIIILSLLISFFISKDFPKWKTRILRFVNPTIQEKGSIVLDDLGRAIFGYIRAQAILILITFVIALAGFLILGVKYSFTLAMLAGAMDLVPVVGTGALFVPWAVYMLIIGHTKLGIGLLITFGLGVAVRQVLEPKILAESIGLDPLITIVTMYAAYEAIGFIGVILAPFLLILFASLIKVQAFHFLLDPDHTDDEPPKIIW